MLGLFQRGWKVAGNAKAAENLVEFLDVGRSEQITPTSPIKLTQMSAGRSLLEVRTGLEAPSRRVPRSWNYYNGTFSKGVDDSEDLVETLRGLDKKGIALPLISVKRTDLLSLKDRTSTIRGVTSTTSLSDYCKERDELFTPDGLLPDIESITRARMGFEIPLKYKWVYGKRQFNITYHGQFVFEAGETSLKINNLEVGVGYELPTSLLVQRAVVDRFGIKPRFDIEVDSQRGVFDLEAVSVEVPSGDSKAVYPRIIARKTSLALLPHFDVRSTTHDYMVHSPRPPGNKAAEVAQLIAAENLATGIIEANQMPNST